MTWVLQRVVERQCDEIDRSERVYMLLRDVVMVTFSCYWPSDFVWRKARGSDFRLKKIIVTLRSTFPPEYVGARLERRYEYEEI